MGTVCAMRALRGRLGWKESSTTFGDFLLLQSLKNYFGNVRERFAEN